MRPALSSFDGRHHGAAVGSAEAVTRQRCRPCSRRSIRSCAASPASRLRARRPRHADSTRRRWCNECYLQASPAPSACDATRSRATSSPTRRRAMRSIVVDFARARARPSGAAAARRSVTLDDDAASARCRRRRRRSCACTRRSRSSPRSTSALARVVEMRYFGGLADAEIAEALGVAERTVRRDWEKARLLLASALRELTPHGARDRSRRCTPTGRRPESRTGSTIARSTSAAADAGARARWLDGAAGDANALAARSAARACSPTRRRVETDDFLGALPQLDAPPARRGATGRGAAPGPRRPLPAARAARPGRHGRGLARRARRRPAAPQGRAEAAARRLGAAASRSAWRASATSSPRSSTRTSRASTTPASTPHGRPYLALEYVDGEPIDRLLPRRTRCRCASALALLLQVAAAVAHAHARLVVHRDLKPSNILVTDGRRGEAARLRHRQAARRTSGARRDRAHRAATGRALTPDYASPEQIRGEPIGTASDVYSLGVVAYELLARRAAVSPRRDSAARDLAEAIAARRAAAGQPRRRRPGSAAPARAATSTPSSTRRSRKAPPSATRPIDAFADDLDRHLRDEPVEARPDALCYRAVASSSPAIAVP